MFLDKCEEVKHDKNSQMPLNSVGQFHYTTLHAIFTLRDTELKQNIDMKIVNKRKMHDISWKKVNISKEFLDNKNISLR